MRAVGRARLIELWRYGQAGLLNACFGFFTYSLFVWIGMNMFLAQVVATILGIVFNYRTYSNYVFREAGPAKLRFIASYIANYVIGLLALIAASYFFNSPYVCGIFSIMIAAAINYFVLKHLVFRISAA